MICPALARVQAHADPHGRAVRPVVGGEVSLRGHRGLNGPHGGAEDGEERVSRRAHLDSTTRGDGPAKDGGVLVADRRVPITDLLEQPGRSFDVGEQEGHCSGRKLCHVRSAM